MKSPNHETLLSELWANVKLVIVSGALVVLVIVVDWYFTESTSVWVGRFVIVFGAIGILIGTVALFRQIASTNRHKRGE